MMSVLKPTHATLLFLIIFSTTSFKLIYCRGNNSNIFCPEIEKQSLLSFKQSMKDPDNLLSSWDGEVICCKWKGVICNNFTGHVHQLLLRGPDSPDLLSDQPRGLSGKINPSLLNLKHLKYLDLSQNNFVGESIPSFIGSFTNLEYLNLSNAGFHGKIPHNIGNLSNLHTLGLDSDLLAQLFNPLEVDSLEWLSGLSQLEYLNMNGADLSKATNWAQVINSLPSLRQIHFQSCSLDFMGMAPLNYVNITSLTHLDLSDHNKYVDLSDNNFQSFSTLRWIFQLPNLLFLDLSSNSFKGLIPTISNATKLQYIDLSGNYISSSIPDWLYFCKDLEFVDLSQSLLHGTVSNAIANLTSLNTLYLNYNQLSGKIPREIANLCKLKLLFLSYNEFEGEISDSFGNMSECFLGALESLYLNGNHLSGAIPISLGKLSSLKELSLNGNKFTGNLPESLGQLFNLERLFIADNMLEGIVNESHFANLTKLETFYASGNHLTLNISPNWIPPIQLRAVGLRSWKLGVGSLMIPSWLKTKKNIWELDLSNTGISGGVPSWFWGIQYLNLSHNHLHGKIPYIRGPWEQSMHLSANQFSGSLPRIGENVVDLDLSNNSFSGDISHFLCDTTYETYRLEVLHLEGNQLSGEFPDCLMKWPSLRFLNLGKNSLSGSIPNSIGFLGSLRSLNLFGNKFSGHIPFSMHKCTELAKINLADNDLDGNLPPWMGTSLVNLMILILRSNNLSGKISPEICHLNSLQILDLSNNQFSCIIPRCVDNFTAMATKISLFEFSYGGNASSYSFLWNRGIRESASVTTKGTEMQYDTILSLVRNIDFSKNNFSGDIPNELTSLVELGSLNLSENHLTGLIPENIGDMKQLESLDLSRNSLSGQIPNGFTLISSLNRLNLSYNNLTGIIPESTQLQSLDASSFIGNNLCGPPLTINCSHDGDDEVHGHKEENEGDKPEIEWFYVFLSLGYAVGFSVVCTAMVLKTSWRDACFGFLEGMWNRLYVYAYIKWARLTKTSAPNS